MTYVQRELQGELRKASRQFGAVIVSGPRRAGKTVLLQNTFPDASYHLLEDPDLLSRARADPRGWLDEIELPAILDEIQNAPELLPYIRTRIDRAPSRKGRWLLTGSQDFQLMRFVTESMTGRAGIFQLLPFSYRERGRWDLLQGGYPEVALRPRGKDAWFRSYLQTYIERDLRALKAVKDLSTFRRFLTVLASRHGQVLNRTSLAGPLGVSVPTVSEWLGVLETTGHVLIVPPYFENFGKRLIKSPKVFWIDSGLVCHLLGLESRLQLERSPFLGPIFEGFVATEIAKNQINQGRRRELYYFRDQQGLEVDFLVPAPGGRLLLVEAKAAKTVTAGDAKPLRSLLAAMPSGPHRGIVVHRAARDEPKAQTVAPGVKALCVEEFLQTLPTKPRATRR